MALTAEQIAEARSEGYSDAEILEHYAKTTGADITAARKEGYSNAEILSHLSGSEVTPEPQAPTGPSALSNPALSGALGAGAGAVYSAKTVPVKAAKAFGNVVAGRMAQPAPAAPSPTTYTTPSGIPVEQTPGGLHPGAVGNAQFNVEQQQANALRQNMPAGFEQRGTSRIMTPVGMQEPAAALGGKTPGRGGSILSQKRAEGWPIVREVEQAAKKAVPAVGGAARGVLTSSPVSGAMAGYNLQDAINRYRAGDTTGAAIGTAGTAASLLPKTKGKAGLIKPVVGLGSAVVNKLRGEPESVMNKAEGGCVAPHIEHMRKGGSVKGYAGGKLVEEGVNIAKKLFTPKETKILRASEALAPHEGKYLNVTQSDRMRSTGGDLGGPGFSRFQTIDPRYEGAAWGVGKKPTASAIVNYNKRFPEGQAIWSPMIGSETQHHSNQHVFDTLADEFNRNVRLGKLTPELRKRANERLQTYKEYAGRFDPSFDIANPEMLAEAAKTFDRRGALAEVMSGKGIGGQKGTIIDYPAIMQEMTDPMTVGSPTHSIGTRLFNLTGEVEHRPDLHSAFPYILKGEDQAVAFNPVPKELALRDWIQNFRDFKGRSPGYYDMTRTIPSQQITEDYLRSLEAAGHAKGGTIKMNDGKLAGGLGMLPMSARTELRKRGQMADRSGIPAALTMPDPAMVSAYNSAPGDLMKLAAMYANPVVGAGMTGGQMMQAASSGDYGDAALLGGLGALGVAGNIPKGVRAIRGVANSMMQNPRAPSMADRLYNTGAADDHLQAVPAMAGGGSAIKGIIDDVMKAYAPKAVKQIEAGAAHTYPPQVPAGTQWMQDYAPAAQAANPAPQITYMGKYRRGTPEERAAVKMQQEDAMRSVLEARKQEYIKGLQESGWSPQDIAEHIAGPHAFGAPWIPR